MTGAVAAVIFSLAASGLRPSCPWLCAGGEKEGGGENKVEEQNVGEDKNKKEWYQRLGNEGALGDVVSAVPNKFLGNWFPCNDFTSKEFKRSYLVVCVVDWVISNINSLW